MNAEVFAPVATVERSAVVEGLHHGAVDETVLETTPGLPIDSVSADAVIRGGGGPQPLTMNCSGKHAGMIATCVSAGWTVGGHLDPDHPLQVHITDSIVAMTAHPDLVGGPARPVTVLMRAVNGLVAKDGAEGVFVAAMSDGRAVAVKIADGARRAVIPVVVDALRSVGVDVGPSPALMQHVLGHGLPVGEVRSVLADVVVPYSGRQ